MLNKENNSIVNSHKIEVFSAGCKFCSNVENEVKEVIGSNDTLITYNLNDKINSEQYYKAAKLYGISSLPAVVVDGKLLGCCSSNLFDKNLLSKQLN